MVRVRPKQACSGPSCGRHLAPPRSDQCGPERRDQGNPERGERQNATARRLRPQPADCERQSPQPWRARGSPRRRGRSRETAWADTRPYLRAVARHPGHPRAADALWGSATATGWTPRRCVQVRPAQGFGRALAFGLMHPDLLACTARTSLVGGGAAARKPGRSWFSHWPARRTRRGHAAFPPWDSTRLPGNVIPRPARAKAATAG